MTIRVYVNERAVDVPAGTTAETVVRTADAALAAALAEGTAYLTDGRGVRVALETAPEAGAIFRVVRSARSAAPAGDDADA